MHGLTMFEVEAARAEARLVRAGMFDWDRIEDILRDEGGHPDSEVRRKGDGLAG